MDKQVIRSVFDKVAVGAILEVGFTHEFKALNGTYEVVVSKVGRGRGGSRVLEVKNTETGEMLLGLDVEDRFLLFGSAVSDQIASLKVNGAEIDGGVKEATAPHSNLGPHFQFGSKPSHLAHPNLPHSSIPLAVAAAIVADATKQGVQTIPNNAPFRAARKKAEAEALIRAQLAASLQQVLTEDPRAQLRIRMKESTSNLNGEWRVRSYSIDEDGSVSMELVNLEDTSVSVGFNTNEYGTDVKAVDVIEYGS